MGKELSEDLEEIRGLAAGGGAAEAEKRCIELLEGEVSPAGKVQVLHLLTVVLRTLGRTQEAFARAEEGYQAAINSGDKKLQAKSLESIGIMHHALSRYQTAIEVLGTSLSRFEELDEQAAIASVMGNIGLAYSALSQYPQAVEYYQKALAINEKIGNKTTVASNLGNLAIVYSTLEDYPRALEYFQQSLSISLEIGNKNAIVSCLCNTGLVYTNMNEFSHALEHYYEALAYSKEMNFKPAIVVILSNIGATYLGLGEYSKAIETCTQALSLAQEIKDESRASINLSYIGQAYSNKEFQGYSFALAEDYLLQSIALMHKLGIKFDLCQVYKYLSALYRGEQQWEKCIEYLEKHYETEKSIRLEESKRHSEQVDVERREALRQKQEAVYRAQSETMEELLYKTFPSPIVPRLKQGDYLVVEHYTSISVLFADLEGFTELCLQIPPEVMIEMLNFIFTQFDVVIKEAGGHRLRTIGDGYFAICGAPDRVEQHQYKLAKAAIAMQQDILLPDTIREKLPEGTLLRLRIGLHSGAAVCGMVGGLEKWQYDAYGDTINTASRMESSGEPGKIHVSEEFKNALAEYPEFSFTPRKPMNIKGKGMMKTYFLDENIKV